MGRGGRYSTCGGRIGSHLGLWNGHKNLEVQVIGEKLSTAEWLMVFLFLLLYWNIMFEVFSLLLKGHDESEALWTCA